MKLLHLFFIIHKVEPHFIQNQNKYVPIVNTECSKFGSINNK